MQGFVNKIEDFRWLELDEKHGTLRVWERHGQRLVLFTDDETGRTYVLQDATETDAT
jgi:hypothetical protein